MGASRVQSPPGILSPRCGPVLPTGAEGALCSLCRELGPGRTQKQGGLPTTSGDAVAVNHDSVVLWGGSAMIYSVYFIFMFTFCIYFPFVLQLIGVSIFRFFSLGFFCDVKSI